MIWRVLVIKRGGGAHAPSAGSRLPAGGVLRYQRTGFRGLRGHLMTVLYLICPPRLEVRLRTHTPCTDFQSRHKLSNPPISSGRISALPVATRRPKTQVRDEQHAAATQRPRRSFIREWGPQTWLRTVTTKCQPCVAASRLVPNGQGRDLSVQHDRLIDDLALGKAAAAGFCC